MAIHPGDGIGAAEHANAMGLDAITFDLGHMGNPAESFFSFAVTAEHVGGPTHSGSLDLGASAIGYHAASHGFRWADGFNPVDLDKSLRRVAATKNTPMTKRMISFVVQGTPNLASDIEDIFRRCPLRQFSNYTTDQPPTPWTAPLNNVNLPPNLAGLPPLGYLPGLTKINYWQFARFADPGKVKFSWARLFNNLFHLPMLITAADLELDVQCQTQYAVSEYAFYYPELDETGFYLLLSGSYSPWHSQDRGRTAVIQRDVDRMYDTVDWLHKAVVDRYRSQSGLGEKRRLFLETRKRLHMAMPTQEEVAENIVKAALTVASNGPSPSSTLIARGRK